MYSKNFLIWHPKEKFAIDAECKEELLVLAYYIDADTRPFTVFPQD